MSLPSDLLDLAEHLATWEPTPGQASLRRALSTAYFALFHLLIRDAARLLVSGDSEHRIELRGKIERSFTHTGMRKAARAFASGGRSPWLGAEAVVPPALRMIAETFVHMQELRHEADYGRRRFTRSQVQGLVDRTRNAHGAWLAIRDHQEAEAFRVALLNLRAR